MLFHKAVTLTAILTLAACAPPVDYSGPIAAAVPASAGIKKQIVRDAVQVLPDPSAMIGAEISRVATFSDNSQGVCVRARFMDDTGSTSKYETIAITVKDGNLSGNQINHPLCSRPDVKYTPFPELQAIAKSTSSAARSSKPKKQKTPSIADQVAPTDGTYCGNLSSMSAHIMESRLAGVPMSKAMQVFSSGSDSDLIYRSIVVEAYSSPNYASVTYQRSAIREFANRFYVMCLRA